MGGGGFSPTTKNQKQQEQTHDDDEDDENGLDISAPSAKHIGGRVRPSSASRGGASKNSRPDSAMIQLRQLGVNWDKEDLLTMQPWALDDSVKELQRRLKIKSLVQMTSSISTSSSFSSPSAATATAELAALRGGSDTKKTCPAPFLPTWELQQMPQEHLTAFQREVRHKT
jgi:hypothetical protein